MAILCERARASWSATPVLCALLAMGCTPPAKPTLALNRDHLDFGTVEAELGVFRLGVALTNTGDAPLRLTDLRLDPPSPELELEGLPMGALPAGDRKVVTVVYRPLVDGSLSSVLRVEAADGQGPREVPITGRAVHLGAVVRMDSGAGCPGLPGSLDFGTVTNGSALTRQVTVESTGTGAISILRANVSPADAGFTVEGIGTGLVMEPGQTASLTVRYDPRRPGPQAGLITLQTNSLSPTPLTVPVCGTGLVSALCVSPPSLQFGTVLAGTSGVARLTASSCGNLPVVLQTVGLVAPAPGFSVTSGAPALPATLAPGESADFDVQFDATSNLAARSRVRLTSSSLVTPELFVPAGANLPPACNARIGAETMRFYKDISWAQPLVITNLGTRDCLLERIEIVPAGSAFSIDRLVTLPAVLPGRSSLDLTVKYTPPASAMNPTSATLQLELDWVHEVSLRGDPRPQAGCHLLPVTPSVDFGLIDPRQPAIRPFGLNNVGAGPCEIFGARFDQPEFSVLIPSITIDGQTTVSYAISYTPAPGSVGPVQGTMTLTTSDHDQPQLDIPVLAGHVRCDPDCHCLANQTPTYWRFSSSYVGSAVHPAAMNETAYEQSCDPQSCATGQVAVEVGRGMLQCAAPPPTCPAGQGLEFKGDGWTCVPCPLIVQYGSLFDSMRACAPEPNLSCSGGESPTFDAQGRTWSCVPTCDNGQYDQRTVPGGALVCIPC